MTDFLMRRLIKNYDDTQDPAVRTRYGMVSGIVGIVVNLILFAGKGIVGLLSASVSIIADAINNLSDAGSSIITLLGFKIASKPADKDHPFGHGRSEYIAGLIIAFLILLLGVELGKSSIDKILHPQAVDATAVTIVILAASILFKIWLCLFNRKLGKRIDSSTILATSQDSLNDVVATSAVLLSTIISMLTPLELDGYMGILVALFILKSGIDVVRDTLNPLLGEAPDSALITQISKELLSYEGVIGIHDLVVHNYGPGRIFATVHVEVDSSVNILISHDLVDNIERDFAEKHGIQLVGHLDPIVMDDETVNSLHKLTMECVKQISPSLSIHDFRVVVGETHTNLIFDIMVPIEFSISNRDLCQKIEQAIKAKDQKLFTVITVDRGYTVDYHK